MEPCNSGLQHIPLYDADQQIVAIVCSKCSREKLLNNIGEVFRPSREPREQ